MEVSLLHRNPLTYVLASRCFSGIDLVQINDFIKKILLLFS